MQNNTVNQQTHPDSQTHQHTTKTALALPIITIKNQNPPHPNKQTTQIPTAFPDYSAAQKIIPGYNFQSLFRKKSHIRLARKKNKEQAQKRNSSIKMEHSQKQTKNIQKGHWTNQQNKSYHWFLELHNRHFILKYLRRTDKIFKSMASFINTRQAQQCRSHHQKMQKKYHSFYQILLKLRMDFYNTAAPDLLRLELQQNGYKVKEHTLISESQLKNGDIVQREGQHQDLSQDSLKNEMQQSQKSSKNHSNILGQNYQNGLHFQIHY